MRAASASVKAAVDPLSPVKLIKQPWLSPAAVHVKVIVTSTVCAPTTLIEGDPAGDE